MTPAPMWLKRDYRATSYALCSCVLGVIFMRLLVYFIPMPAGGYGLSIASKAFVFVAYAVAVLFLPCRFAYTSFTASAP